MFVPLKCATLGFFVKRMLTGCRLVDRWRTPSAIKVGLQYVENDNTTSYMSKTNWHSIFSCWNLTKYNNQV